MAATREEILVPSPIAAAGGRVIASPFQWLFSGEDSLRLVVANSASGVTVRMQGRFLSPSRGVQVFTVDLSPTSDRVATSKLFAPGDGYLLNLSVVAVAGAPVIGQTYAMVQIVRGFSGAIVVLGALLGGYVTTAQHLAYPGSPIQSSIEGGGYFRTIQGTTPAVGANVNETVPLRARWEIVTFRVTLQTSAVAGNREVSLVYQVGSTITAWHGPLVLLPASSVAVYVWQRGPTNAIPGAGQFIYNGCLAENVQLTAGTFIFTTTVGIDAADVMGGPTYTVREWLEVA